MGRRFALVLVCIVLAVVAYALVASCVVNVDCSEPHLSSLSPEGTDSLAVCRRPMLFSMPGGGSDAPGWIVLRDQHAFVTGIVALTMVQLAGQPEWSPERVDMKLTASLPRSPTQSQLRAWLTDRQWRLRAVLGLVPSDTSFR